MDEPDAEAETSPPAALVRPVPLPTPAQQRRVHLLPRPERTGMTPRTAALAVPLILVNSAAIYGQQGWAYDHLGHQRALALMFAVAIESIGIYLAAEAHAALMA